eukprot:evm.model.scf_775.4 EVM.evm.TU.scf_775.4   scf_775:35485-41164(+)
MDPSRWHEGQEERCAFAAVGGRPRGDDAPGAAPWTSGSFHMGAAIGEASDGFSRGAGPFGASPFVGCGRRGARQRRRNGLGAKRGGGWQKQTAEFNVESVSAEGCSGRTGWPSASPSFSPPGQPGGSPNGVRSEFELGWDGRAESRRQSGLFALHPAPSQGPFASTPACDASGRSDASDADSGGSPLAKRPSEGRREGGGRDAGPERERPVKHMPASPRNEREQAEYKPPMDIEPPSATAMAEERGAEGRASGAADMFASTQPPSDGGRRGWFSFGFGMVPGWAVSPAVPKAPPPRMNTLAAHLGEMELGGECTAEGIDLSRNVDSVLSLGTSPVGGGLAESDAGQSAGIGSSEKEGHRCREGKGDAESKGEGNASECEEREEKRQKIRYPVDAQNRRSASRLADEAKPWRGGIATTSQDETPDSIKQNPVQEAAGVPRMPVCTPFPGHVASGQQAQKTTEGTGQEGAPEPAVDPLRASGTAESENQVLQGGEAHKKKGNALFAQGKYYQAEAEYTKALEKLECLSSSSHLAPLFCNRAAVWLMTSNPMRALEDCQRAQEADKVYARAYLRGSTCHLRLGRFAAAKETLESAKQNVPSSCSMYLDLVPKLTEVQQLESQFERVKSHLMQSELTEAGIRGGLQELEVIEKEVSHSEELWALKVLSLLRAGDRGRVVPALDCACKTLDLKPPKTLWWQWVAVQAWFHDGKQEEVTRRATQLISAMEQQPGEAMPCPTGFDLRPTVTELKDVIRSEEVANRIKLEGNAAFKGQNYKKAIELYGKTLAACKHGAVSRRFLSIVLSNRAAAYQGAGAFAEAIADCCMAQTVDTTFARAQVRLARLLMQVSRPQAAVGVLQKVVDSGCATNSDHREALLRLGEAQAMVTKDPEPDHYRMLGLKADCKIEDVKKAYRQLALRLHPDKAALNIPCLSLKFGSSGVKVLGESRIRECIKEEASWLFKLVNEAHNTLTDLVNRRKLERELFEMRKGHSSVSGNASRHDSSIFGFSRNNGNTFWPSPRSGFHNQRGGFQHQRSGFPNHHGRFQNSQGHYMHRAGHAPDAFNSHAGWHSNRGF